MNEGPTDGTREPFNFSTFSNHHGDISKALME